jgi:hypothetical protein
MAKSPKTFPVIRSLHDDVAEPTIPWSLIEPHREQVATNHGKTLEELAIDGGLNWRQIWDALQDKEHDPKSFLVGSLLRNAIRKLATKQNNADA